MPRNTPLSITARKQTGEKISCLTSYTAYMTKLMDEHIDLVLVGDSVGMVLYGMETTLGVTMDMMCAHGKAVSHAAQNACVVVDMPFGSYQESKEQAYRNAVRIMAETGADAVKLEGGVEMAETIKFLTTRGVAVMAHIGLQPQSVNTTGGYRVQGKNADGVTKLIEDGVAVENAGAFSVVIECVAEEAAQKITKSLQIPTIGIGASVACDGQVLVTEDMLGFNLFAPPKFVKQYANFQEEIQASIKKYTSEVREGSFPCENHVYEVKKPDLKSA